MCVTFKAGMVGDIIIFIALIASFKYRFIALYMGNSPNKSKKNEKKYRQLISHYRNYSCTAKIRQPKIKNIIFNTLIRSCSVVVLENVLTWAVVE